MKKFCLAAFIYTFFAVFAAIGTAADLKNGFLDYKWGTNAIDYPELKFLYSKGEIGFYSNPGQSYSIKEVTVDNVIFGFYEQKLFAVYIEIDNFDVYDTIEQYLKSKYGLPDTKLSLKDYQTSFKWKYEGVVMKLKTDQIGGRMKLGIYYSDLIRDLREEQVDQMSEASYRFLPIDKNKTPEMIPLLEF